MCVGRGVLSLLKVEKKKKKKTLVLPCFPAAAEGDLLFSFLFLSVQSAGTLMALLPSRETRVCLCVCVDFVTLVQNFC